MLNQHNVITTFRNKNIKFKQVFYVTSPNLDISGRLSITMQALN